MYIEELTKEIHRGNPRENIVEQTSKIVLTIMWKFSVRPDMNDEFTSGLQSLCTDFVLWLSLTLIVVFESLVVIFSKLCKKKKETDCAKQNSKLEL